MPNADCSSRQNEGRLGPYRAFVTAGTLRSVQKLTGRRRYTFSCSKDAPLSNNTLNKRRRLLGIDTKTDHCAHGLRTTFSTLYHHEEIKDAKAWDGDVVEQAQFLFSTSPARVMTKCCFIR